MVNDYGMADASRIYGDMMYSSGNEGILPNFVFGRPREAYEYDSTAATGRYVQDAYLGKYGDLISGRHTSRRMAGVTAGIGLGSVGRELIGLITRFKPGLRDNITGHFGGQQAVAGLLNFSDAIAQARNNRPGGAISDPVSLHNSKRSAAILGGLAYSNNFDAFGTIDTRQTHGLGLETVARITGGALSDRSQYEEWARKTKEENKYRLDSKKLTDKEIDNFKDGVGLTKKAAESFNEHIKKFTGQLNGFVSSVSKMTGSYEEAISFMQRMTGGKMFAAGEAAAKARSDAARMAISVRVAAADAGIPAQELYAMSGGLANNLNAMRGVSRYSSSTALSNIAPLAAIAISKALAKNTGATREQKENIQQAGADKVADFASGDAPALSTVAAWGINNGSVDKEKALGFYKRGDAAGLRKYLESKLGKEGLNNMLNDRVWMAQQSSAEENQSLLRELNTTAFVDGHKREMQKKGKHDRFARSLRDFSTKLGNGDDEKAREIRNDISEAQNTESRKSHFISVSGLDYEKSNALAELAEKENWSYERVRTEVSNAGGDVEKMDRTISGRVIRHVTDKYGADNPAVKKLTEDYRKAYGKAITQDDRKKTAVAIAEERNKESVDRKAAAFYKASDKEGRDNVLKSVSADAKAALEGTGTSRFGNSKFLAGLMSKIIGAKEGDKSKTATVDKMVTRYEDAISRGKTEKEAMAYAQGILKESYRKSDEAIYGFKKDLYNQQKKEAASNAALDKFLAVGGFSEEEVQRIRSDWSKELEKHGGSDSDAIKETAKVIFAPHIKEDGAKDEDKTSLGLKSLIRDGGVEEIVQFSDLNFMRSNIKIGATQEQLDNILTNEADLVETKAVEDSISAEDKGINAGNSVRNDSGDFDKSKAIASLDDQMEEAYKLFGNDLVASQVDAADARDARENNRGFRSLSANEMKMLRKTTKADVNVKTIQDNEGKLLAAFNSDKNGSDKSFTQNDLAVWAAAFMNKHKDLSDEDFEKQFKETFSTNADMVNAMESLKEEGDGNSLSTKRVLGALAAGRGKTGKERRESMAAGYTIEAAREIDTGKTDDRKMQDVLEQIRSFTEDIRNKM